MDFASPQRYVTCSHPPIQCVPGVVSFGINPQRREADHSRPSSAKVEEGVELYPLPNTPLWRDAEIKHRDNFTLPLPVLFFLLFFN